MKRIYIAILFFIIVSVIAAVELGYVTGSVDLYISKIELTDKQVYKSDFENALNSSYTLENNWKDTSKLIDIMLDHSAVDKISESLSRMTSYIQNGSIDMYFAESNKVKKELATIREGEYPYCENIL